MPIPGVPSTTRLVRDAHHVVHWIEGGATAVDNLVLLCNRHHHVVHEPGWVVRFDGDELRVLRPDGHEVK